MSERIKTCAIAYRKGVAAAKEYKRSKKVIPNPYSDNKRELQKWWNDGHDDFLFGSVDEEMTNAAK